MVLAPGDPHSAPDQCSLGGTARVGAGEHCEHEDKATGDQTEGLIVHVRDPGANETALARRQEQVRCAVVAGIHVYARVGAGVHDQAGAGSLTRQRPAVCQGEDEYHHVGGKVQPSRAPEKDVEGRGHRTVVRRASQDQTVVLVRGVLVFRHDSSFSLVEALQVRSVSALFSVADV